MNVLMSIFGGGSGGGGDDIDHRVLAGASDKDGRMKQLGVGSGFMNDLQTSGCMEAKAKAKRKNNVQEK